MPISADILREEELTLQFEPAQAKVSSSFDLPFHYNLVVPCPEILGNESTNILESLAQFPELFLSQLANYHLTVLILADTTDRNKISTTATLALQNKPLNLTVKGMHIRPPGVFLNVYSPDESLVDLRQKLAHATDTAFDPKSRLANIGWITLGRFIALPSQALIDYIRSNVKRDFGDLNNALPALHHSNNSQQLGTQIFGIYTNK